MRILFVNKFLYPNGGSETYIFELGKQLKKMGHEVQYFGMEHKGRIVGNHAESYTADMDFHGGGPSKFLYPFKIIYSREARKKIRKVLDDFRPDVVHLNNFNFQLTPSIIYEIRKWEREQKQLGESCAKSKTVITYTAHDYQWVCPNHMMMIPRTGELCFQCRGGNFGACTTNRCIHGSVLRSMLGTLEAKLYHHLKTYNMVDLIICPSHFMKEKLATEPVLRDKLIVMHNFLGNEKEMHSDEKTVTERSVTSYILYFGRYSEEKGVRTLLQVCKAHPEIPFVFAGGGPLKDELARCSNIEERGFLHGEELRTTIQKARFSVFTSECYENCPFSVIESQWYGTPVLASNIGGVPELLQDGVTGTLFEAGNREELESELVKIWTDEALCHRYRMNCRKLNFDTTEQYCEKLIRLFEEKISQGNFAENGNVI